MNRMQALILQINDTLENNIALMYKSVFIGETASILKKLGLSVCVCDPMAEQKNLLDLINLFCMKPELVIFVADVNQARVTKRVAEYCKACSKKTKIMVIGRATTFIPQYFMRKPFDAVHISGDREAAIISFVQYLKGNIKKQDIINLCINENGAFSISKNVEWLEPKLWQVPDLSCLPIEAYKRLNNIQHPDRKLVLGITSMKGCNYGCKYCGASLEEGKKVRYGDVETIINWANTIDFDCLIQLWSPDVLNSLSWLEKFVNMYKEKRSNFSWRGVARLASVDEAKIKLIKEVNCDEISIGIEMIKKDSCRSLKGDLSQLFDAIELFGKYDIKLKCLLMLGYPGFNLDDVRYTIDYMHKYNLSYRITGYTPLHNLLDIEDEKLDKIMIENYDRRLFYNETEIDSELFYKIISSNGETLI